MKSASFTAQKLWPRLKFYFATVTDRQDNKSCQKTTGNKSNKGTLIAYLSTMRPSVKS